MFKKLASLVLIAMLMLGGLVSFAPALHAQTNDQNDDDLVTTTNPGGVNYSGSMTFTGQLYTRAGAPVNASTITEGTYYTAAGTPIYYVNGWYYYPIATTVTTGNATPVDGTGGVVTPGAPNTGSSGTDTTVSGVVTPGAPNTGAGGISGTMWFALVFSALVGLGGLTYVMRRVA